MPKTQLQRLLSALEEANNHSFQLRKLLLPALVFVGMIACAPKSDAQLGKQPTPNTRLIRIANADESAYGYLNQVGDTVVPFGQYQMCFTDTATHYAAVYGQGGCVAIGLDGKELFGIYWFDNGPDYVSEGLFRIKKDGKIGYANEKGEVVIAPTFACASPFENGRAQVAYECTETSDGEHTSVSSEAWFFIDPKGKKVAETKK